ncbi:MAG: lysostaphin resistance A-like protein [Faecousia sp.]
MNEKQINKWLRRRFSPIGWALVGYFVLLNVMVATAMAGDVMIGYLRAFAAGNFQYIPDTNALSANAWGYIAAIPAALIVLYAWKGGEFWKTEVLAKEKPMKPGILACMLCLCAGSQMVNSIWISLLELILNPFGLSAVGILETVSGSADTFSMFLYSALLAPVAEELMFRGFVLRTLRPYGKRFAVFGSAFLFGLFHGNLLQTPYAFLMGLVLGYVTVEYSIGWAVVIHMFNNLVLADLLARLTAHLPEVAVSGINLAIFGSCFAAGLAILISRRQEIREYNRSEWMDRRCLKCFFGNAGVIVLMVLMLINMIVMLFA